jgi:hypothetical protein
MRTPRPSTRSGRHSSGSVGTLIGNGWLREPEKQVIPSGWTPKSRSALRKCMFMEMPPDVAALAARLPPRGPAPVPAPMPVWKPIRRDDRLAKRVDPHVMRMKGAADPRANERAWWEDPIALGTLLIVLPPVGLACVWGSKHYSNDARWALTVMSALLTCFAGAVVLALLVTR